MTVAKIEAELIVTSSLMTLIPSLDSSILPLKYMPFIHYLFCFKKDYHNIKILMNSGSEINAIIPAYTKKLGFQTWKTNLRAQKTDGFSLTLYGIVIVRIQVSNKLSKAHFFQKTFLLFNTSINIMLRMFFLTFSNAKVLFVD